jgi:tripartite-type tricarboxylate transporter receptor subunit TctC
MDGIGGALRFAVPVRGGAPRALVSIDAKPMSRVPESPMRVPPGYPSMDVVIWNGLLAPTGTPAEVLARAETDLLTVLKDPQVQKSFANQGAEMTPGDGRVLGQLIRSELARFSQVIREAKIRLD